jgi:hypothetical protein
MAQPTTPAPTGTFPAPGESWLDWYIRSFKEFYGPLMRGDIPEFNKKNTVEPYQEGQKVLSFLTPSEQWNDLVQKGLIRDFVAYGVGVLLILVGLAMVAFGPAKEVATTVAKAVL